MKVSGERALIYPEEWDRLHPVVRRPDICYVLAITLTVPLRAQNILFERCLIKP